MKVTRLAALAVAALFSWNVHAQELADLNKPVTLDLPGLLPFVTSSQPIGGWPLTIRMLANRPVGIGTYGLGIYPPVYGAKAWIVWADPDGKFSPICDPRFVTCPPYDETALEFTVGLSPQGRSGAPQVVNGYDFAAGGNGFEHPLGPPSGGYGHSTAVPGLVVLSNVGLGREFTTSTTHGIAFTGRSRNLAGFVDSVGWTANDHMPFLPRTSVTAQMNVPYALFKPILFVDYGSCTATVLGNTFPSHCPVWKWSLEGRLDTGDATAMMTAFDAILNTIRIFVLDGPAPDFLEDLNGDGVVNARDALRMVNPLTQASYRLLSGERVIKFNTIKQEMFPGIPFDLDGDGMVHPPAPAMPGGVVRIP